MSVFRAFIAVDMSEDMQQRLHQVSDSLQEKLAGLPVRWVPVQNIHLTLKFLGDVSMANLDMLKEILHSAANGSHQFAISIGNMGVFPNWRRLRVVWLGVEGPPELQAIQRGIDLDTSRLGYRADDRPFSPHLTLGRISRNAGPGELREISKILQAEKIGFLGVVRVDRIRLYRSDLQPGGAVYSEMYAAPLRQKTG